MDWAKWRQAAGWAVFAAAVYLVGVELSTPTNISRMRNGPDGPHNQAVPSPNYSNTPIVHDLVIVHDMEGFYEPSVAYLCLAKIQASAHL